MKRAYSAFLITAALAAASSAQTLTTLATFDGANGLLPQTMALAQGTDGNFYGATYGGGAYSTCSYGCGTVFKITPAGTLTTLYSFTGGADGGNPDAGLALGVNGNLYGTTGYGGSGCRYGCGTIFEITSSGTLTTLYTFTGGSDGSIPAGGLYLGADGNFYGAAESGGNFGQGTLFKISPSGTFTALHNFTGASDGGVPIGVLVQAADGDFYGTTSGGGANGNGTVFKISPSGMLATLHAFTGGADGGCLYAGLVQGANGSFYGPTYCGGANGFGTIFEIAPSGTLTTLYNFTGGADGSGPYGGLAPANDGNLYGASQNGAAYGFGTIFKVSQTGTFATLYSFTGGADGAAPAGGLLQGTNGEIYGTTAYGGSAAGYSGDGTVFGLSAGLSPLAKTVQHSGAVGSAVLILGSNLTGAKSVTFDGMPAAFTVTPTEITTSVPAGALSGRVLVTATGGASLGAGTFLIPPVVSSFSPPGGPAGTAVTINGQTFTGATGVAFGGVPATTFTVTSYTRITATVPAGAKSGRITVLTPSGDSSSAGNFVVK